MRPETRKSMEMLFSAKWNLPKAAAYCNLSHKEMKITFYEDCNFHQPSYNEQESTLHLSRSRNGVDSRDDLQNEDGES